MKTMTLLSACMLALTLTLAAAEPSKTAAFQIRLVLDVASADSEPLTCTRQGGADETLNVQKKPLLDRSAVKSASVQKNAGSGDPQIHVTFTDAGTRRFAEITRFHVGQRLAIVIDGKVYSAPKIMAEISGGKAVISGNFSEEEARQMAATLSDAGRK